MRPAAVLVVLTAVVSAVPLLAPAASEARYFLSRAEAQRLVRDDAEQRYGEDYGIEYATALGRCRPQGQRYNPRYVYHRWVCSWAGEDFEGDICSGTILIIGSRERDSYYSRVIRGIRCYYR